jgi:hypothetical protein
MARKYLTVAPLAVALLVLSPASAIAAKKSQTITVEAKAPSTATIGATYHWAATASSGLPVSVNTEESASVCSTSGSTITFKAEGTCRIDFNQAGSKEYERAPEIKETTQVTKRSQTIAFTSTAPSNATVGGPTYEVKASGGASGNPVTFTTDASSSGCSISGATVSFTGAGTCKIDANQAGSNEYFAAPQVQQSFAVAKKSQTTTFTSTPSSPTVSGPTYTVTATASSGLAVSFSSATTSVCTVSGSTVSFVAEGGCTIVASQAGNNEYEPAPETTQSFKVTKKSQSVAFTSTAPSNATVGGPTYEVKASGGPSGNPVTFTTDAASSGCSISGATVSFTAAGTCKIDANQAGNANYNAAPQVQQSFSVAKGAQTISFSSTAPSNATVGGPSYEVKASGGPSGNPVTFTTDAASSGCSISGATVSFTAAGTCKIDANQAGSANYNAAPQVQQSFSVGKKSQTVAFTSPTPSGAVVGGPAYNVAATASSGLAVSFSSATTSVCTVSGSTVSFVGGGTCTIEATQEGNAEYSAAKPEAQSFSVERKTQTLAIESLPPNPAVVGSTYAVKASASSGLPPSLFGSTPAVCKVAGMEVTFVGEGTCTIEAKQEGSSEYSPAEPKAQEFAVSKRAQKVAFTTTPPSPALTGTTYTAGASASSGLPVVFVSMTPTVCTISGSSEVKLEHAGTCMIEAKQEGNTEVRPAKATQSFQVKIAQTISFTSTAPSKGSVGGTYLVSATASSGLMVAFTLDAASSGCTLSGSTVSFTGVGTCTIDANQAGNGEYEPAPQVHQVIEVAKGAQTITFTPTAPSSAPVGGRPYEFSATGGASGNPVIVTLEAASSVCTLSGSTVSFTGVGTCKIDANQAGSAAYEAAPQVQQVITVVKGSQTITFTSTPSNAMVGDTYEIKATAGSGEPVAFTLDAASKGCTLPSSSSTVTFTGVGTCKIDANQAGNANYNAAPQAQQLIEVAKGTQTITFVTNPPKPALPGETYAVAAKGGPSEKPVKLSSPTPGVCRITGPPTSPTTVQFRGTGECEIEASQAGNEEYEPAPLTVQRFTVGSSEPLVIEPHETHSTPPPPIKPVEVPPIPNSSFKVIAASLSLTTYAITFEEAVVDPGTFTWVLTFENGKYGVFAAKVKRCKSGSVRLKGKCRPGRILFARGRETVAAAGTVTFMVRPTTNGIQAMKNAFKLHKGLPVSALVTFQSARGGPPASRVQSLIVKGRR